jgi:hypothetical protein
MPGVVPNSQGKINEMGGEEGRARALSGQANVRSRRYLVWSAVVSRLASSRTT